MGSCGFHCDWGSSFCPVRQFRLLIIFQGASLFMYQLRRLLNTFLSVGTQETEIEVQSEGSIIGVL